MAIHEGLLNTWVRRTIVTGLFSGAVILGVEATTQEGPSEADTYKNAAELNELVANLPPDCEEAVHNTLSTTGELHIPLNECGEVTMHDVSRLESVHGEYTDSLRDGEPALRNGAAGAGAVLAFAGAVLLASSSRRQGQGQPAAS